MRVSASAAVPSHDCLLCPRLFAFREVQRAAHSEWFNAPVPSFGDDAAELLIVGLAPGLRGANRTGRPFTGDYAGGLLYQTLRKFGFSEGLYDARTDDGVVLRRARITNAVRCVPPQNKPEPGEIATCRRFLAAEITGLPKLRAILALGTIAHQAVLEALGLRRGHFPFAHGGLYRLSDSTLLADSYHCSRLNTNTGRLTVAMFESVFISLAPWLDQEAPRRSPITAAGGMGGPT
ncbi:MAG: uracil-DNA glycosylase [Alphaproteobacteria bacterium]|nr:uracil-DNA glycosylase [Alphaproteobacteria bacterium]